MPPRNLSTALDVQIEAGQQQNARVFRAHSVVLNARSPYFQAELAVLSGYDLGLQDLCEQLQLYLIQKKSLWLLQNFAQTKRIAFHHEAFKRLQLFCDQVISNYPETVFLAKDFALLDRQTLLSLLHRDDLTTKEINIWQRIIEWGIAHTSNINSSNSSSEWTPDQFASLKVTLAEFLPLVRIFQISAYDLQARVFPFVSILPNQVVEDLMNLQLNPNHQPISQVLPPRHRPVRSPSTPIIESPSSPNQTTSNTLTPAEQAHANNELAANFFSLFF
ncbi:1921_t:CDS:2 [Ambispora gerdemannii]|uniref:1921_t:CDS:1 n=1 Tax=Ambispora gerdemannii TaxID=144530 RepID=A0A9N9GM89_9GLOM|nr:1921_t:CDS:2 [Ambispora gerdemannii]